MALMRDLNQYLQKRGERWHYVRRVPKQYDAFDNRVTVRKALRTESLEVARKRRDELVIADDEYWVNISQNQGDYLSEKLKKNSYKDAMRRYEAAKAIAMAHGFLYKPIGELAKVQTSDILNRLEVLEAESVPRNIPSKDVVDAMLGTVVRPKISLSQAFELYCDEIASSELIGKSEAQKRAWRKVKSRAVNNFIVLNGDIAMTDITREHAKGFHKWWSQRIMPTDPNIKALSANSGNRDMGNLNKLYRQYWEYEGEEERTNPFRKLRFTDTGGKDVLHFSNEWVRLKILAPGVFKGLNHEAALIVYALIETGCRPSEIANLRSENICLNADIPHIRIRNAPNRQLKSKASARDLPLVGVSLKAMQQAPEGFPHYRDRTELLSASLMKAFKSRGLFPTPDHRIYSFRHSFEKRMLEAGVDYGLRCILMGHQNTRPSYGDGGSLTYRRDQLLKIMHPVLDGIII